MAEQNYEEKEASWQQRIKVLELERQALMLEKANALLRHERATQQQQQAFELQTLQQQHALQLQTIQQQNDVSPPSNAGSNDPPSNTDADADANASVDDH